jgi:protoheme IX farnesyltransferase
MIFSVVTIVARRTTAWAKVGDYAELARPRIAALVMVTVAVAAYVASRSQANLAVLLHAMFGTLLVAASAGAVNQWLERFADATMPRTANRPLASGRMSLLEAGLFAALTLIVGVAWLCLTSGPLAAAWALVTWGLYCWVYTPLKYISPTNTAVGAIAGAMPIAIGWAAGGGHLDLRLAGLFSVLFLWQFPHFMAIAWLYRKQYERAGMQMLTVVDGTGRLAGWQAIIAGAALIPASVLPAVAAPYTAAMSTGAGLFVVASLLLGLAQLAIAWKFAQSPNDVTARRLLRASLIYLPAWFLFLMIIPWVR